MYIYIYNVHTQTHTHTHTHTCMHAYIHTYTYTYTCSCIDCCECKKWPDLLTLSLVLLQKLFLVLKKTRGCLKGKTNYNIE